MKLFGLWKSPEQSLGQLGEKLAQKEYKKRGYRIVGQNIFNRRGKQAGEIDFIAKNKASIVFVEVKTRAQAEGKFGTPEDSVNMFKQQKFLKAVKLYLAAHPSLQKLRPQIDVCAIVIKPVDRSIESVKILTNVVEDQF